VLSPGEIYGGGGGWGWQASPGEDRRWHTAVWSREEAVLGSMVICEEATAQIEQSPVWRRTAWRSREEAVLGSMGTGRRQP
jgi:hypothetical protein